MPPSECVPELAFIDHSMPSAARSRRNRLAYHVHGQISSLVLLMTNSRFSGIKIAVSFRKRNRLPSRRDFARPADNIKDVLFVLQCGRNGAVVRRQPSVSDVIRRHENCPGLRRSVVVSPSQNVAQHQRTIGMARHGVAPVADEHVDSPLFNIA